MPEDRLKGFKRQLSVTLVDEQTPGYAKEAADATVSAVPMGFVVRSSKILVDNLDTGGTSSKLSESTVEDISTMLEATVVHLMNDVTKGKSVTFCMETMKDLYDAIMLAYMKELTKRDSITVEDKERLHRSVTAISLIKGYTQGEGLREIPAADDPEVTNDESLSDDVAGDNNDNPLGFSPTGLISAARRHSDKKHIN